MFVFPLLLFVLGTFIGSFLGVLIDRLPKGKTILGRSHCDFCKKPLSPLDLIPIISFVLLLGKCRYCKKRLSFFYPAIEIITGLLFMFIYLNSGSSMVDLIYYLTISSGLLVIFFADLKYGIIPDKILIVLFVAQAIYLVPGASLINHTLSLLAAMSFFLILFLATKGRGMGLGDVKFAAVLGFILGFPNFVLALYLSFLTGSIASIILVLWGKKKLRGDTISFGPFMVLGTFQGMFFSKEIMPIILPFLIN